MALANASKYGLGAGIWTSDLSRAHRVADAIEAGLVWVNTHHRNDPSSPWYVFMKKRAPHGMNPHSLQGGYERQWDWTGKWI